MKKVQRELNFYTYKWLFGVKPYIIAIDFQIIIHTISWYKRCARANKNRGVPMGERLCFCWLGIDYFFSSFFSSVFLSSAFFSSFLADGL